MPQVHDPLNTGIIEFDAQQLADAFLYINNKWQELSFTQYVDDGTIVGLPHAFVVPSIEGDTNFSFQEMYYWDSYFIARGLIATGHQELAEGMLENLIVLLDRFHIIPNASRTYFTGRSQPPLLTSYIFDIYEACHKDNDWLREKLVSAEREYHTVWTSADHPNWRNVFEGLSRYYDINLLDHLAEAESGWDMTTRFHGNCLSYIPIDLNSLLYKYEADFARGAIILGEHEKADEWKRKAEARSATVSQHLWNQGDGFFFDFDYITQKQSEVWSLASFYTMWSGLATPDQAKSLVSSLRHFMHRGGLTATAHSHEWESDMPTQWAYPNGWAPLHWMVVEGLKRYGFVDDANQVARLWLNNNLDHFNRSGVFREAYNVVDPSLPPRPGLYPPQLGFGWTNAVFVDLAKKHLSSQELHFIKN
jgi:alpha,alpha-trehalase